MACPTYSRSTTGVIWCRKEYDPGDEESFVRAREAARRFVDREYLNAAVQADAELDAWEPTVECPSQCVRTVFRSRAAIPATFHYQRYARAVVCSATFTTTASVRCKTRPVSKTAPKAGPETEGVRITRRVTSRAPAAATGRSPKRKR